MSASPFQRRVNPEDLGRIIRFELEDENGTALVYLGPAAEEHVTALNSACTLAQAHGMTNWPLTAPEIVPLAQIETGHEGGLNEMARMALRQRHDVRPVEPRVSPMQFLVFSALIRFKQRLEVALRKIAEQKCELEMQANGKTCIELEARQELWCPTCIAKSALPKVPPT